MAEAGVVQIKEEEEYDQDEESKRSGRATTACRGEIESKP
jgi:hypothetical protein